MNLYLVSQGENTGYDTYDSMIVSAKTEDEARKMSPSPFYVWSEEQNCWMFEYSNGRIEPDEPSSWAKNLENVRVELIGKSTVKESKVILASFNAG